MTQRVFDNDMVAHVWAQRSQDSARSHNGNFSFSDDVIYSYSTPIARFIDVPRKGTCVLVTSHTYSMTTSSKHMPAVWRGLGYSRDNVFTVPHVSPLEGGREHIENLAYLVDRYHNTIGRVRRMRDYYRSAPGLLDVLERYAAQVRSYAKLFKLKAPKLDPAKDAQETMAYRAEREAKRNTPEAIAKREKDRERRLAREARIAADRLGAWKRGELRSLTWKDYSGRSALLRVRGDQLETSQGASVPLDHAIRVYRFVKLCRERGEAWERNGRTLRVGHFQVDSVNSDGSFRAGCHFIAWEEIEQAAIQAGVTDLAPQDTRETRELAA